MRQSHRSADDHHDPRVLHGVLLVLLAVTLAVVSIRIRGSLVTGSVVVRVLIGGAAMGGLGVHSIVSGLRRRDHGPHDHSHHEEGFRAHLRAWALILPVLVVLTIPLGGSSSLAADRLFLPQTSTNASGAPANGDGDQNRGSVEFNPDGVTVFDWGTFTALTMSAFADPGSAAGHAVDLVAFVHREAGFDEQYFVAARMSIFCCAADAVLVGLLCRIPDSTVMPEVSEWVRVRGELGVIPTFGTVAGTLENVPVVEVTELTIVDPPDVEYAIPGL